MPGRRKRHDAALALMHWCLLDPSGMSYHPGTPLKAPLGGSQSALSYLALALQARGHRVSFVLKGQPPPDSPVPIYALETLPSDFWQQDFDLILLLNQADFIAEVDWPAVPLVFWNHHLPLTLSQSTLAQVKEHCAAMVFVSHWQQQGYLNCYELGSLPTEVIGNAIAPHFAGKPTPLSRDPVLAYTSTPRRGLEMLLPIYQDLRREYPALELQIFSSFAVYQIPEEADGFATLYGLCRSLPGVSYRGGVPQPLLAEALRQTHLLAYPNLFPETFCTAALEALAAGCRVVTSALGALPETTAGYARLVPWHKQPSAFYQSYLHALGNEIEAWYRGASAWEQTRQEQADWAQAQHVWDVRVEAWESLAQKRVNSDDF